MNSWDNRLSFQLSWRNNICIAFLFSKLWFVSIFSLLAISSSLVVGLCSCWFLSLFFLLVFMFILIFFFLILYGFILIFIFLLIIFFLFIFFFYKFIFLWLENLAFRMIWQIIFFLSIFLFFLNIGIIFFGFMLRRFYIPFSLVLIIFMVLLIQPRFMLIVF